MRGIKRKLILGVVATIVSIVVFMGVLLLVQHFNTELDDINLIVNNFKRIQTLSGNVAVTDMQDNGNTLCYRLEDTNITVVLELDKDWKNGQKGMRMWQEVNDLKADTAKIKEGEHTNWLLSLSESRIGPWLFYKEINMNQQANLNVDTILDTILDE